MKKLIAFSLLLSGIFTQNASALSLSYQRPIGKEEVSLTYHPLDFKQVDIPTSGREWDLKVSLHTSELTDSGYRTQIVLPLWRAFISSILYNGRRLDPRWDSVPLSVIAELTRNASSEGLWIDPVECALFVRENGKPRVYWYIVPRAIKLSNLLDMIR